MGETLLSLGLDVGTTTTSLILSRLTAENRASAFAVPDMQITQRRVLYRSEVIFTPICGQLVDGSAIRDWVAGQYALAGIAKNQVDTGAVIITGETSRRENADQVLRELSGFAGDFVVATAGPHLESVLAAKGAGADIYSEKTGKRVLHMDIGGGTANLALIEQGRITATGCLNVGGRLLKLRETGTITYVSPALRGLCDLKVGDRPTQAQLEEICAQLTQALEMAAGLRQPSQLLSMLSTAEAGAVFTCDAPDVISFSGGVADCIEQHYEPLKFGDIGPLLGRAIRESRLCAGHYRLGTETIRATVIGAGSHSASLSGSTVYVQNVPLPLKNLPVITFTHRQQERSDFSRQIAAALDGIDGPQAVLAMPGYSAPTYSQVRHLAQTIAAGCGGRPVFICLENDMAKALGHCLCLLLGNCAPILCIDRLKVQPDTYLDLGAPVGPALPVVIKTLILSGGKESL